MQRACLVLLVLSLTLGFASNASCAESWGDLTGQFIFDGTPPVPEKAKITSDKEVCCEHDVINESLLVDPESKGIKNIIVVLTLGRTDRREVPIHEVKRYLNGKVEIRN